MNTAKKTTRLKIRPVQLVRIAMQCLAFILVPDLFIRIFSSFGSIVQAIVGGTFSFSGQGRDCLLAGGVLLLTVIWGRFFCGFLCSFGAMQDLLWTAGKHIPFRPTLSEKTDRALKKLKYAVLLFIVVGVWIFALPQDAVLSPWTVFGAYIRPWKGVPSDALFLSVGGLLLLLTVIGSLFVERFFCKYLCPLGAIFTAVSHFRLFRVRRKAAHCPAACRLCTGHCPMSIPLYTQERVCSGECIDCMKCTGVCPNKNITAEPIPAVSGTVAAAAFAGMTMVTKIPTANVREETAEQTGIVQTTEVGPYTDGVYTGTGSGFRGETTVRVTVESGYISDITVTAYGDDEQYFSLAQRGVIPAILKTQSTDVAAVSGATFSSRGILRAVEIALSLRSTETEPETVEEQPETSAHTQEETTAQTQEETTAKSGDTVYADGVYTGTGSGFRGETTVRVTVENGMIEDITVTSYSDDPQFFSRAQSGVIDAILESQSVDVATVSGATFSSNSIREAVANALSVDFSNPNGSSMGHDSHGGTGGEFGGKRRPM